MSSAVKAIRYLLVQSAALTAVVDPDRIGTGRMKEGTALPAVIVSHVSTIRSQTKNTDGTEFCTSRVQVSVFANAYPDQDAVQKLVRGALPSVRGTVNGVAVDNISPGGDGPDLRDDLAGIYMGTADFIITFNE